MEVDKADTEQNCAKGVKQERPRATGATWEPRTNRCWAEYGSTLEKASKYRTCLFQGKILSIFVINNI